MFGIRNFIFSRFEAKRMNRRNMCSRKKKRNLQSVTLLIARITVYHMVILFGLYLQCTSTVQVSVYFFLTNVNSFMYNYFFIAVIATFILAWNTKQIILLFKQVILSYRLVIYEYLFIFPFFSIYQKLHLWIKWNN